MTNPKLYQYNVCPFCWKVKALLYYKKIPHEIIEVHPLNKKEISFSKDYRKVPIYIDSTGKQINDSTPIMRHIDAEFPEKPVFEKDPERQKMEDQWLEWANEKMVRALPPLIYKSFSDASEAFDYITKVEKFSWIQRQLVKYSGAAVMTLVAKKSAKSQQIENPEIHVQSCLKEWEKALGSEDFLGGQKPNGADLAIYGVLRSIEGLKGFQLIQKNKKVLDWYQRITKLIQ